MPEEFSGTNTERIQKLVATMIDLGVTLRMCFGLIGVGVPLMLGLLIFLVVQSLSASAKIDRLSDQIAHVRSDYEKLDDRLKKLEQSSPRLSQKEL